MVADSVNRCVQMDNRAGSLASISIAFSYGYNGDSLFTFIKYATGWRKTKQVMLYNEEARTFQTRPIAVAMAEVTPADRVMGCMTLGSEKPSCGV